MRKLSAEWVVKHSSCCDVGAVGFVRGACGLGSGHPLALCVAELGKPPAQPSVSMFACCLDGSLPSPDRWRNVLLHYVSPSGVPPTIVQRPVGRAVRNLTFGAGCYYPTCGFACVLLGRVAYHMGLPLVSCQPLVGSSALCVLRFCACMGRRRHAVPALGPPLGVILKGGTLRFVPPSPQDRFVVFVGAPLLCAHRPCPPSSRISRTVPCQRSGLCQD